MSAPIQDIIPKFTRGATFEAIINLPDSVEEDYFDDWFPLSQIRKEGQLTKAGIFGELDYRKLGPRRFVLETDETDKWPLGVAEFDVLFSSRQGRRIRTKTLRIEIIDGITRD